MPQCPDQKNNPIRLLADTSRYMARVMFDTPPKTKNFPPVLKKPGESGNQESVYLGRAVGEK